MSDLAREFFFLPSELGLKDVAVKNECSSTFLAIHFFEALCLVDHRDNIDCVVQTELNE